MKRSLSLVLIIILSISLFAGCGTGVSPVKIDLNTGNYTVRENTAEPISGAAPSAQSRPYLDKYLEVVSAAIDGMPATAYTFDFSAVGFVTEAEARNYLIPALAKKYGQDKIIDKAALEAVGIWAVPTASGLSDDVKQIWISAYKNADGKLEFVADILRNGNTLKNIRFVEEANGALTKTQDTLAQNYDGTEPAAAVQPAAEETSQSKTLYFGGILNKTGIFERPVLNGIDFSMKIEGSPVTGGSLPGGFAGGFEGVVTIDGMSFPLTLDGAGLAVPVGMVSDPSQYYIAFSNVGVANPQDPTVYRNVYFIKKDLTSAIGLYSFSKSDVYSNWFETARITSSAFDAKTKENNGKLTALYSKVIVDTYGSRMEYNNMLAVIYNMFIGVDQGYLKKSLKPAISSVSKDIRDYTEAINDANVAKKGENGLYFFPNGRSMVVRILSYDGTSAIAAIDFSSMQDNGYGALYKADYKDGAWVLTVLQNTRIK